MKILFVCLGNICRSPLAEGIMQYKALQNGIDIKVDSAGTSDYHIGEPPDSRGIDEAESNGIDISHQRARQFRLKDFEEFDLILAMDKSNFSHLIDIAPNSLYAKKIKLYMNVAYPGEYLDVPDPYYDGKFGEVFDILEEASENIINKLNIKE